MSDTDTELHRKINILDTFKDAGPKLTKTKVVTIVEELVNDMYESKQLVPLQNNLQNNKIELDKIQDKIFKDKAYGNTLNINILDINKKIYQFLPDTYKYAIMDTVNPSPFLDNFDEIETPGAFMDPGNRHPGKPIQKSYEIDLNVYGFPNVVVTSQPYNKNTKTYAMNISFFGSDYSFNINRNGNISDFKKDGDEYIDDDEYVFDLCAGNSQKDIMISSILEKDKENTEIPALSFLFKELGDTLQVIFAHEMFKKESETYSVSNTVAFTHDNVYAVRCRLLGVPCVRNARYKIGSKYDFLQPLDNPEEQLLANKMKIMETIKSNNIKIKVNVNKILLESGFIINKKKYNINSLEPDKQRRFRSYIKNIGDAIDIVNETIDKLFQYDSYLDYVEFKIEVCLYEVRPFISDKGIICTEIKELLMGDISQIPEMNDELKGICSFDKSTGFAGSLESFFLETPKSYGKKSAKFSNSNFNSKDYFQQRSTYRGGADDNRMSVDPEMDVLEMDIETYEKIRMKLAGNDEKKAYEIYAVLYPFLFFTNAIIPSNGDYIKKIFKKIVTSYSKPLTKTLMKEFSTFINALDSEYDSTSTSVEMASNSARLSQRSQSRRSRSQRSRSRRSQSQPPRSQQQQFFINPKNPNKLPFAVNKSYKNKKAPVVLTRRQQRLQSHNKHHRKIKDDLIQQRRWGIF